MIFCLHGFVELTFGFDSSQDLCDMSNKYDVIVIGSGVGGMCAVALLAYNGFCVLLAEKRRYLGGRFSTWLRGKY